MNVVVIGAQWGDEGKGKIVDFLAERAGVVVRYSGGANAGHTIVTADDTYKLHLVPSGILYAGATVVLGTGMVIDLEALFEELDTLTRQGVDWHGRVLVSDRAHLVLPSYREIDRQQDRDRAHPLGTTGRGIGVAYAMKAARDGIRVGDIDEEQALGGLEPESRAYLERQAGRLRLMVVDLVEFMTHTGPDDRIVFEGAQGALLDLDQGTYPYVSSGYSAAAGASLGGGIGPRAVDRVLGVFKAYSTRVGNGPFPSEFRGGDESGLEELVRETGREYGVTTGRPRRCGYLDLVALKYIAHANGLDGLALTHLDVYDSLDEVKVCVAYESDDGVLDTFPASAYLLDRCRPVTKSLPGWGEPIGGTRSFDELPERAREYIGFIERFVDVPVDIVGVGYEREQTIVRNDPWTRS
ncbi:MAG: adenylosuccinate synthase [Spirochaetota bacterium]